MEIEKIRHSLAHIMAEAVKKLYPKVKFGMGPAIENGFYYDFDFKKEKTLLSPADLPKIEEKMQELIGQNLKFEKTEISKIKAKKLFKDQPYKLELIKDLKAKKIGTYQSGEFLDLCKGPHIKSTAEINPRAFKLTRIAGAYWKGDEKNPMLKRIYGLAFETEKELQDFLKMQEEAEKRDHKKIGQNLELFFFDETAPGIAYWLPKGLIIYNELVNFWRREHEKRGYQEVKTPLINKKELYLKSGHWEHYQENMFLCETKEKEIYALKPMNCPNAMVIFSSKNRSYRDLPLRLSDVDAIHRYELSGTLNGLLRLREFSQDDAHIFISEEEIKDEYRKIFEIAEKFYSLFNLNYSFRLGTRPKDFMGDKKTWDKAEENLKQILKESERPYVILEGDGAFYGPKIDILMKDSLGRDWQMGTIQLDFQIPKKFNLEYADKDGNKKTPVVIHRVIFGALERFIGILLESCAGNLPFFLSPVQIAIIPVSVEHKQLAEDLALSLKKGIASLRIEIKNEAETVSKKIREGETQRIPYLLVLGNREKESGMVSVRERGKKEVETMGLEKFIEKIKSNLNF